MKKKLISVSEKWQLDTLKKEEVPEEKKRYMRQIIRKSAPNWVQKNIR
jgi:hypothetical protein